MINKRNDKGTRPGPVRKWPARDALAPGLLAALIAGPMLALWRW